jgi:hypothetical protein
LMQQIVPPLGKIRQKGGGRKKNGYRQGINWHFVVRHDLIYSR